MFKLLGKIFGNGDILSGGIKMIDDAFYTDSEKAEDKAKAISQKAEHKLNLLKAYAPFKIAQRYIAVVFLFLFSISFIGILVATGLNAETQKYIDVIDAFKINYIMGMIVMFYFSGGLVESAKSPKVGKY